MHVSVIQLKVRSLKLSLEALRSLWLQFSISLSLQTTLLKPGKQALLIRQVSIQSLSK